MTAIIALAGISQEDLDQGVKRANTISTDPTTIEKINIGEVEIQNQSQLVQTKMGMMMRILIL